MITINLNGDTTIEDQIADLRSRAHAATAERERLERAERKMRRMAEIMAALLVELDQPRMSATQRERLRDDVRILLQERV